MNQSYWMSPKTQRAATFALVALFMAAIFMLVNERLNRLNVEMNDQVAAARVMSETDASRATLANDIRFHADQSESQLALLFFTGEKEKRVSVYGEMDKHNAALDVTISRITPLLATEDDKKLLSGLVKLRESFRNNLQETVDALELNDREKAMTLLSGSTQENLQEMRSLVIQLVKGQRDYTSDQKKEVSNLKEEAEATLSRSRAILIGLGLGAAMIGLLLGMLLTRRVAAP